MCHYTDYKTGYYTTKITHTHKHIKHIHSRSSVTIKPSKFCLYWYQNVYFYKTKYRKHSIHFFFYSTIAVIQIYQALGHYKLWTKELKEPISSLSLIYWEKRKSVRSFQSAWSTKDKRNANFVYVFHLFFSIHSMT